jgi:hypothetical protein
LISMNRRLYWTHLKLHEVVQGAVHVHYDYYMPHVQGQAHGKVQKRHEAHKIDYHEQGVVLNTLRSTGSCSGCSTCSPYTPCTRTGTSKNSLGA